MYSATGAEAAITSRALAVWPRTIDKQPVNQTKKNRKRLSYEWSMAMSKAKEPLLNEAQAAKLAKQEETNTETLVK